MACEARVPLTEEGARFEEAEPRADHAVRDGRLITGQNPWSSASVAQLLVDAVEELGGAHTEVSRTTG